MIGKGLLSHCLMHLHACPHKQTIVPLGPRRSSCACSYKWIETNHPLPKVSCLPGFQDPPSVHTLHRILSAASGCAVLCAALKPICQAPCNPQMSPALTRTDCGGLPACPPPPTSRCASRLRTCATSWRPQSSRYLLMRGCRSPCLTARTAGGKTRERGLLMGAGPEGPSRWSWGLGSGGGWGCW